MLKRLYIYYKERYPLLARLLLGMIVFGEIYFIILLNYGVLDFRLGMQEVTGAYTVFAFLLWLRVADDLKDFETDKKLFPYRPLASGRLSLTSQPINVTAILNDAVDMYTELAKKQEIELVLTNPNPELIVMGDRDRLKQVFINIVDNAVKYTVGAGQVLVSANVEEACVRITVTDTGVGIPAQDIDRVKEKFYKANKTVRGSGIGLAVADEIIKQMNGLLFIESTENVGTKVTIVLPLYEEEILPQEEGNVDGK